MEQICSLEKKLGKGLASRIAAYDLLDAVHRSDAYANLVFPQILEDSKLEERDRAFATELGYSTLRMQGRYDYAISLVSDRDLSDIDEKLLDVLRLGAHQIFAMNVPNHASINETVDLANKVVGKSRGSFANAIFRNLVKITDLDKKIDESNFSNIAKLSIKYSHPEWIVQSFIDRLGDIGEVELLLAENNNPAKPNLIAWPGKSTKEELLEEGASEINFVENGVIANMAPIKYRAIKEKRAGVQDAGSQLLVEIFHRTNIGADLQWLDLCAAPGGKAKYLYQLLGEKNLQANEINPKRFNLLKGLIPSDKLSNFDGRDISNFSQKYDRILIDAPCTGLGALRRRPEARWRRTPSDLKELVSIQRDLISSSVKMLNNGGIIAYVTCSPHTLETKAQIADVLRKNKNLELIPASEYVPIETNYLENDGTIQMWSHRMGTDSMFMAFLRKHND